MFGFEKQIDDVKVIARADDFGHFLNEIEITGPNGIKITLNVEQVRDLRYILDRTIAQYDWEDAMFLKKMK